MRITVIHIITLATMLAGCVERHQMPPVASIHPEIITANRLNGKEEGKLTKQFMDRNLVCPGKIETHEENKASVSPVIAGIVKEMNVNPGDTVKQGQALMSIESPEIIKLQQEYLEADYQLACLKKDYERQGILTLENATSFKKMEKVQSDYLWMDAKVKGLGARLSLLHINPQKCSPSHFISQVLCYAPIDGTITEVFVKKGQYVNPEDILAVIENTQYLQLALSLPAEYYDEVKTGMQITFENPVNRNKSYQTAINKKSALINSDQQFEVNSRILIPDHSLLPGLAVETLIDIHSDSVWAIPINAILWEGTTAFIYIRKGNYYIKTEVITGDIQNEYIEIKNPLNLHDQSILMEIVDNLNNF